MRTTIKATDAFDIEMPPSGGDLARTTLEDEAHALRVMLDKSENFRVAVGQKLLELLNGRFAGNRSALRDWYEAEVAEGKAHRAWGTVERYLVAVKVYGEDAAADRLAFLDERKRQIQRKFDQRRYNTAGTQTNDINDLPSPPLGADERTYRPAISEYEQRRQWLAQMDHLWFRGKPEWRKKWLAERGLKSTQSF